jgi:hypothetical protein
VSPATSSEFEEIMSEVSSHLTATISRSADLHPTPSAHAAILRRRIPLTSPATMRFCEGLAATPPLEMIRISSGSLYVAVGGDLRRRLGHPTRTKVSSGSDIANSYMHHGLSSGGPALRL